MKLRLLLFEECNRSCPGCCNRDWDLVHLPICSDYTPFECVMLTGGEPMLHPEIIRDAVQTIRAQTSIPIYLYTAVVEGLDELLPILDGVTVTLHTREDVAPFCAFEQAAQNLEGKSLRLNMFREAGPLPYPPARWMRKEDMEWIPNCPLPDGEVMMRYPTRKKAAFGPKGDVLV